MADGRLAGRIALVTGASSGIGEAIALGFAREGADVIVHYRTRKAEAEEIAGEIRGMGRRAHVVQADIADAAQVARMMEEATVLGPLSTVACNAGARRGAPARFHVRSTQRGRHALGRTRGGASGRRRTPATGTRDSSAGR